MIETYPLATPKDICYSKRQKYLPFAIKPPWDAHGFAWEICRFAAQIRRRKRNKMQACLSSKTIEGIEKEVRNKGIKSEVFVNKLKKRINIVKK